MTHSEYLMLIPELLALQIKVDNGTATDEDVQRCAHLSCLISDYRLKNYDKL